MLYAIEDQLTTNKLMGEMETVEAGNSADAVRKYLDEKNVEYTKIQRSGSRSVRLCAIPVKKLENGRLQRIGRKNAVWYEVLKGDSILRSA